MKNKLYYIIVAFVFALSLGLSSCNKEGKMQDDVDRKNPIPENATWQDFVNEMERVDSARTSAINTVKKIGS